MEYHAQAALSHSKVKFFSENFPRDFHDKYIAKKLEPEKPNEAFDIGHAVEALLCGQDTFNALVQVNRQWPDFKTAAARQWRDECRKNEIVPLSQDNETLVTRMRDAVMRNPDAAALIAAGTPQVTFRVKGKITDVQCRCDWWGHAGTVLPSDGKETGPYDCDLKSCASLAPSAFVGFEKHALQLGYHHAAIWYRYVIRMVLAELAGEPAESLPFVRRYFIAVDKKEWPSCCVYTLPEILLDTAERDLLAEDPPGTLPKLIACLASGVWPDAPTRKEIEVPKWMEPKGGLW
ncbi:MAG: PD-(D/E)XK nuclease-like domain-containing protein [Candidatus Binatia bacterium]|nr:PD-(D/E)XK nuclease-like domain-containing protein [Candidatus Binatia bacterium]